MANTISPEEEAAIKAAMWVELGAARLDNLPMEDNSRGRGCAYPPGFGPPRAAPVNSRWQQAIESGDFNDDDAAMVSNMDSMLNGQLARSRRSATIHKGYQNFQPAFNDGQMSKDRNGNIPPRARPRYQGHGGPLGYPNHRGLHAGDGPIDIDATLASKGRRQSPGVHHGQNGVDGNAKNQSPLKSAQSNLTASNLAAPHSLGHTTDPSVKNAPLPPPGFVVPQTLTAPPTLTGVAAQTSAQVAPQMMEDGFQPNTPSSLSGGAVGLVNMSATKAEELPAQNTQSKVQSNMSVHLDDGDTVVLMVSVMVESRTFEERGKHAGTLHLVKGRNVSDSMIVLLLDNQTGANIKHFVSDCTSCITADSRQGAQVLMFRVAEHTNVFYTISFGSSAKSKPFIVALQDLQSQIRSLSQSNAVVSSMESTSASVRHQPQPESIQPESNTSVAVTTKTAADESMAEHTVIKETVVEKVVVEETVVEEDSTQLLTSSQSNQLVGGTRSGPTGLTSKNTLSDRAVSTNVATQTVTTGDVATRTEPSESQATHSIEMPREWHDWVTGAVDHICATAPESIDANVVSDMVRTACIAAMMTCSLKSPRLNMDKLAKTTLNINCLETGKDVSAKVDLNEGSPIKVETCEQAKQAVVAVSAPPHNHCEMSMENESEPGDRTDKRPRYELEELVGLRSQSVDPPSWLPECLAVLPKQSESTTKAVGVFPPMNGSHSTFKKSAISNETERAEAIQSAARLAWQLQGHNKRPSSGNAKVTPESGTTVKQTNINASDVIDMRFRSKPDSNRTSTVVDSDDKGVPSCASTREPNSRVTSPTPRATSMYPKNSEATAAATHSKSAEITSPKRGLLYSRHNYGRNILHDTQLSESHQKISQIDEAFGRLTL